jgi:hypothetical protein
MRVDVSPPLFRTAACPFRKFYPARDSHREPESTHDWGRCLQSCATRSRAPQQGGRFSRMALVPHELQGTVARMGARLAAIEAGPRGAADLCVEAHHDHAPRLVAIREAAQLGGDQVLNFHLSLGELVHDLSFPREPSNLRSLSESVSKRVDGSERHQPI